MILDTNDVHAEVIRKSVQIYTIYVQCIKIKIYWWMDSGNVYII